MRQHFQLCVNHPPVGVILSGPPRCTQAPRSWHRCQPPRPACLRAGHCPTALLSHSDPRSCARVRMERASNFCSVACMWRTQPQCLRFRTDLTACVWSSTAPKPWTTMSTFTYSSNKHITHVALLVSNETTQLGMAYGQRQIHPGRATREGPRGGGQERGSRQES